MSFLEHSSDDEKISVLVVDDEADIVDVLKDYLEESHLTHTAFNAEDAWSLLENSDIQIDVVLCDINMPGMEGPELLRKISTSFPDIGVIMISGSTSIETAVGTLRNGAYDFITKPFSDFDGIGKVIRHCHHAKKNSLISSFFQHT